MEGVYREIRNERDRQKSKGFNTSHDDVQAVENFCDDIINYAMWAKQMSKMGSPKKFRRRIMQIGALAVAACESFDRKNPR